MGLKEAEFRFNYFWTEDVAKTLETIESEKINKVSIHFPFSGGQIEAGLATDKGIRRRWVGLDLALVKLLALYPNCVRIVWYSNGQEEFELIKLTCEKIKDALVDLLPTVVKKVGNKINNIIEIDSCSNLETWFI